MLQGLKGSEECWKSKNNRIVAFCRLFLVVPLAITTTSLQQNWVFINRETMRKSNLIKQILTLGHPSNCINFWSSRINCHLSFSRLCQEVNPVSDKKGEKRVWIFWHEQSFLQVGDQHCDIIATSCIPSHSKTVVSATTKKHCKKLYSKKGEIIQLKRFWPHENFYFLVRKCLKS